MDTIKPALESPQKTFSCSRRCCNCNFVMEDQAIVKRKFCTNCNSPVPLSSNEWTDGWNRCPVCFCFIHKSHSFCETCSWMNEVGVALKKKADMELLRKVEKINRETTKELRAELEVLRAYKREKEAEEKEDLLLALVDDTTGELKASPAAFQPDDSNK